MSANSAISWTDHTFNPWWGCFKVSAGCANCYAETFAKRTGHSIWGPPATSPRRLFGDKHWQEPLKWHAAAEKSGQRARVFCASMADVFEDHPEVVGERRRLFALINLTPWLDWQLLTKRPENVASMVPEEWAAGFPPNVWLGTSVEDQDAADARIPYLLAIPAAVRFLSCEPLLGPVNLVNDKPIIGNVVQAGNPTYWLTGRPHWGEPRAETGGRPLEIGPRIHWVIVGGESGPKHRPMDPDWLTSLLTQCHEADVPVWVKQDSGLHPGRQGRIPDALYVQQFPRVAVQA